ncbi:MAG: hypothetical protein R2856_29265 [Caldilineaceae bacterium]
MDTWLRELETAHPGVQINVIYEADYAGTFIATPQSISGTGRVIVTSTSDTGTANMGLHGVIFGDLLPTAGAGKQPVHQLYQRPRRHQSAVPRADALVGRRRQHCTATRLRLRR